MGYIQLHKIEKSSLKKKMAEDFNTSPEEIKDEFLEFMKKFVKEKHPAYEYIKSSKEVPPSSPDTISLLIPCTYYHVNVKKTTWMIIGLLLDLFITKGAITFSLSMLGAAGQTIHKLNPKNGEVCIYYQALTLKKKGGKEFLTKDISIKIDGRNCSRPEFKCGYSQNGKCTIELGQVKEIFQKLKEIGAFSTTQNNKWRVKL